MNEFKEFIKEIHCAENVKDYCVRIILATHPDGEYATPLVNQYVRYGSSPRGAQALINAGKIYAAIDGRLQVDFEDIRKASQAALRHRTLLNFEGEAEGIETDKVVDEILSTLPEQA